MVESLRAAGRRFGVAAVATVLAAVLAVGLWGCNGSTGADGGSSGAAEAPEKIVFAWEPSNSGSDYEAMRDAMAAAERQQNKTKQNC